MRLTRRDDCSIQQHKCNINRCFKKKDKSLKIKFDWNVSCWTSVINIKVSFHVDTWRPISALKDITWLKITNRCSGFWSWHLLTLKLSAERRHEKVPSGNERTLCPHIIRRIITNHESLTNQCEPCITSNDVVKCQVMFDYVEWSVLWMQCIYIYRCKLVN